MGNIQNLLHQSPPRLACFKINSQIYRFQANIIITGGQDSETEVQALETISNLATSDAEDKQTIEIFIATNASIVAELMHF